VGKWNGLPTATREQLPVGFRDWRLLRHREYYLGASDNWLSKYLLVRWFKNRYDKHRSSTKFFFPNTMKMMLIIHLIGSSAEPVSNEAPTGAAEAEPGPRAADAEHAMSLKYMLNKGEEEEGEEEGEEEEEEGEEEEDEEEEGEMADVAASDDQA
jgi:hypothetical protein